MKSLRVRKGANQNDPAEQNGSVAPLHWGHGFRSFQGAAIVFLGQTTAEGSIRVLKETPDHLG